MAEKQEIMAVIEKLRTYEYGGERPIAVVGPKLGKSNKPDEHLRAYAFGGFIGAIPAVGSDDKFQLADENYAKYLDDCEKYELQSMLGNCSAETLCSDRYLELILKAAERKFTKSTNAEDAERKIENNIVCRFMNTASQSWAAVDMEFTIGENCGQHDIVFYDASDAPCYIITELKYNCRSTHNIDEHIEDMKKLYALKDKVRNELNRRMGYLCEYGLVSQAMRDSFINSDKNKIDIRFGILYVGGGEKAAKDNVKIEGKAYFESPESEIKKLFYYQYCDALDDIDIEKMKRKPLADIMKK